MDDLILSVVRDRRWEDLDCYAISLDRCGYKGRKVMFVEDVPMNAQDNLRALGFEVIPFTTAPQYRHLHFQSYRYHLASMMPLEKYRYVFWTDVCDLVFQTDPSEHFHGDLIAVQEGWLIKNQPINDVWIKMLVHTDLHEEIREKEVLCSGTFAGPAEQMDWIFTSIWETCKDKGEMQGIDQGIFNCIVRSLSAYTDLRIPIPQEGFVCTCGPFLAPCDPKLWTIEPPAFDFDTGLVYTHDRSKLFSVVHQYNRTFGPLDPFGRFRGCIERRYRG